MCSASSDEYLVNPVGSPSFEEIQRMVEAQFDVKESFVEHGIPTFHVGYLENSKEGFLRLMKSLESLELLPLLRRRDEKVVLQIVTKPVTQPSRKIINIALFFATLGTVFISGYLLANAVIGALLFTGAIMVILGSHEMGHKILADKHDVEATYPYFIPGIPPLGTFGALIRQKTLPPNRDSLFDIGFTGPLMSFLLSVPFIAVGLIFSSYEWVPKGEPSLPSSLLMILIQLVGFQPLGEIPPVPSGSIEYVSIIRLHPLAFAGWIGILVTILNLVPSGMFDGGHVARSAVGEKAHKILSYVGVIALAYISLPMAFLALLFAMAKHPGPLDDVSKLTTIRKVGAIGLVVIFILAFPFGPLF
jgi:Zn-dependent protease